jgi:hypothetical protein
MMGDMTIRELASDLSDVAARLAAVAADGDEPLISGGREGAPYRDHDQPAARLQDRERAD